MYCVCVRLGCMGKLNVQTYLFVFLCVQVSMLQTQVQTSESLLQDLQKSFSQSQNAVQSRLVSLMMLIQVELDFTGCKIIDTMRY